MRLTTACMSRSYVVRPLLRQQARDVAAASIIFRHLFWTLSIDRYEPGGGATPS
jgi:hypothetical protein